MRTALFLFVTQVSMGLPSPYSKDIRSEADNFHNPDFLHDTPFFHAR